MLNSSFIPLMRHSKLLLPPNIKFAHAHSITSSQIKLRVPLSTVLVLSEDRLFTRGFSTSWHRVIHLALEILLLPFFCFPVHAVPCTCCCCFSCSYSFSIPAPVHFPNNFIFFALVQLILPRSRWNESQQNLGGECL